MRHLDLFSGIGGFALAARWAGIETVGFCEIEEFPRKVLQKNFPGVPIHHDIRELNGEEYAGIDLITGGYPCQPFSEAGNKRGKEDDRHLWPEVLRIVKQARPAWVICENVAGHITLGLDDVLFDLEGEGYATRTAVIPACAADARHKRNRVWIIANTKSNGDLGGHRDLQKEDEGEQAQEESREDEAGKRINGGTSTRNVSSVTAEQGRGTGEWQVEPRIQRVVDGIPDRVDRNKSLGNAIVPQVAYQIMMAVKSC